MVSMNELKQDMIIGMGYIGLDSGRLYRMRRGPKLIEAVASGTTIIINDATEGRPFRGLRVFGKSTQDGMPSVENPVPIVNAGEGGSITVEVTGRNLLKPNSYNTYYEFPLKANTVITLMTNGKPSQGGNIKFSATDGSTVWFSIDAGQTRVCRSIGSKDVKGFYDQLKVGGGLEYMFAVGDIKTYTPYVEPQSLTLATPNGLPGVPVSKDGNYTDADGQQWICDEIDLGRGKYVQRVKEVNPADYDDWILDDSTEPIRFKVNRIPDTINERKRFEVLSNRFVFNSENKVGVSFAYADEIYFYLSSTVTTVEQAKQWFVDNPTTLMYMLGTPIEINLTPEEIAAYKALRTYGPTTVITNDAGAGMEVTYVADRKEN